MARLTVEQVSQAGGEISPLLASRRDLDRWATSWRRVENLIPIPEGVLTRRPGTRYLAAAYAAARPAQFIPFTFADEDALMLVLNGGVIRFFGPDGTPVESAPGVPYQLAHPWTDAELDGLRWWQQGNLVFVASAGSRPRVLTRVAATTWTIAAYDTAGGPVDAMNLTAANQITVSGAIGSITVTANFNAFTADMVGGVWRMEEQTFEAVPVWSPQETVAIGVYRRWKGRIYASISAGATGVNPPEHEFGQWSAGGGAIIWAFVSKAYGYFRIESWISTSQVNATVLEQIPQSLVGGYTWRWSPAAWDAARGWPTDVHMHQQSLVWARGDVIWITKPGDFYDFDIPPTAADAEDSGNAFRLTSPLGPLIQHRWFVSGLVLIAGTSIGAFVVRGANPTDRLTPLSVRSYLDDDTGAASIRPARTGGGAVFVGPSRRRLYFLQYERLSERLEVQDLTRYARGVLRQPIAEIAYQREPHRIVWLRHDDGSLSSITFWPEEQYVAVARHPLGGGQATRIAALVSPGQTQTDLWLAVRRTIAGVTNVYYEKLAPFFEAANPAAPTAAGAWHLDSALEYGGAPATVLSGLGHLEGQSVLVNADGRQSGPHVVASGQIALPFATTNAIIGLAAPWLAETLPREAQTPRGPTLGRAKTTPRIVLELYETLDVAAAAVTTEGVGEAEQVLPQGGLVGPLQTPALVSGVWPVNPETVSDIEQRVRLSGAGVFPATLLGVHPEIEAAV